MSFSRFLLTACVVWLAGCTGRIPVTPRLEQEWAPAAFGRSDTFFDEAGALERQYPGFGRTYLELLLQVPLTDTASFMQRAVRFSEDAFVNELYAAVGDAYPDFEKESRQLDRAFSAFEKAFASRMRPVTVTVVSLLGESVLTGGNVLAVALDKYLGADATLYREAGYAAYQKRAMQRACLVPDAMRAWLYTSFPHHPQHVLDAMIYEGKVAWTVSRLCPSAADTLLFGFSAEQLEWCRGYRHAVWDAVVSGNLLYETDETLIRRLMSPAPYTARLSAEAPGRTLCWMGLDIIRSYVRHHPRTTPEDLFGLTDSQAILHEARYNP